MDGVAQGRRRYDASGRRRQAQATRERVLDVARRLFVERGYAETSVARIAAEAGVSERTVFAGFTSKVLLLKAAVDTAVAGDAADVPLHERPAMRRVHEAATAEEAFERLADAVAEVGARAFDVVAVLHRAADADPQIARLERELEAQRLTGAGYLAATVADRLGVTDAAVVAGMRDTIWVLASPLQYALLVRERGWPVARYRDWLARALARLVPPADVGDDARLPSVDGPGGDWRA